MLLTKEVEVKITSNTFKYYKELGYKFEHTGDIITVKVEDLPKGSNNTVDVLCDYCNENVCHPSYKNYNRSIKKNGKYSCIKCHGKKTKETNLLTYGVSSIMHMDSVKEKVKITNNRKYGVDNYSQTEECKDKIRKTCIERYGVESAVKNEEIKSKIKNTMIEKYGVDNYAKTKEYKEKYKNTCMERFGVDYSLKSDVVREKGKKTIIDKYGVEYPMRSEIVKQKLRQTNLEKYGVDNPNKLPEIREKIAKTLYKNSSQKASSQQRHLHNLYGGELNYPISYYNVDICIPKENITIEYNGGGHMLNVITGKETQEEYNQKEIVRNNIIKRAGYKQITIVSSKDYLPSDTVLLQMLDQSKEYFNTTNHTWVEYNIDTSLMRNAENKEGVFFDFGELRKIKKTG